MTLCEICNGLEIDHNKGEEQRLGSWKELVDRSAAGCEGCSFFTTVLTTSDYWSRRLEDLRDRVVFLDSVRLDCRKADRLNTRTYSCDDLLFDICSLENIEVENPEIDSYRPVPISSRDNRCIDQIKSWFQKCLHHDNCKYFEKVPMPTRVIQVPKDSKQTPKLVVTDSQHGEYVALSQIWDRSDSSKLTAQNLRQFQQEIDLTCLSQNFLDALEITRRLGFEYIWIETLCIIQDDEDDRSREASKMANTYGLAAMTISATAASDSQSGIFSDRHVYYSPILGRNKDRYLRPKLLRWNWDIERSPLAQRGWAAQERMLSPRVLHFTKRQIIWECASAWYYEASGITDESTGSGQIDHSYRKTVFQPIVNAKLTMNLTGTDRLGSNRQPGNSDNDSNVKSGLTEFAKLLKPWLQNVAEYSGRSVTVPSDKLPAVAGIAAIIDNGTMGDYLAGIWSRNIEIGLSWSRQYALLTKSAEYRAPSWSWASVDGKISYDIPTRIRQPQTEPLHSLDWVEKHRPALVEHNMVLQYPWEPYMAVTKDSYIVLGGSCITYQQFTKAIGDDSFFTATVVPDCSSLFDCPCCGPGNEGKGEHVHNVSDLLGLFMVLHGERWHEYDGYLTLLILRESQDNSAAFERSGIVRLAREACWGENDPEDFARALDDLGFERKLVKLL